MPFLKITDEAGVSIDAELAPASTWLKYAREIPGMLIAGDSIQNLQILTLNDPLVKSLQPALSFQQPVELGKDVPELTIRAEAGGSFRVIQRDDDNRFLFSPDEYGDNIEIPAGACYVGLGFHGTVGVGLTAASGALHFGVDGGGGIAIEAYRAFPVGPNAATITEALRTSIADFVIPAGAEDFENIPAGGVVTVTGTGTLTFSATANLLAIANPLATVSLPSPLPALSVKQGASASIGASYKISSEYQMRVRKTGARHVRLGWYRKHGSELKITASASAAVSAGLGNFDLFASVISAVSRNAEADLNELRAAGLDGPQAQAFQKAVAAAVNRKLEISLAAEFGSMREDEAAFLYDVDLDALGDTGKEAIRTAIHGDLSSLADLESLPAGITGVSRILSSVRGSSWSLKINLLGIFNYGSVTKLALSGKVTFTPSGEMVIADTATAKRFMSESVNFGADEDKLRHLMAETFLITAAYRGSGALVSPPELTSSHLFFRMDAHAHRSDLRRDALLAAALELSGPALPDVDDFGRTSVLAEARYDDALAKTLFLRPDGTPRAREEYEDAGRRAIQAIVLPDGDDAFRLEPATNDDLWARMKHKGPVNLHELFPKAQADGVLGDYVAIQWWADSMRGTAEVLAEMNQPGADMLTMREKLAAHLRDVAAKAHELFGSPWGLLAMFFVSGGMAETEAQITGPKLVFTAKKALRAAV